MAGVVPQKVEEYEAFINERLKRDLQTILDQRDKVYSEIAEYLQLKNTIERIQETHTPGDVLKTRIDVGCNFYVNANVSDTSKIYVHVGYGFYPELTLPEALQFIEKKTKILTSRSEKLTSQASSVKAQIRLVLEGLKEIQNIEEKPDTVARDIFL